jgi:hypothetical protein
MISWFMFEVWSMNKIYVFWKIVPYWGIAIPTQVTFAVWCPQPIGLIQDIEKVQRRAIKYIFWCWDSCTSDVSHEIRLQNTKLIPVSYWQLLDLVFMYKLVVLIVHKLVVIKYRWWCSSDDFSYGVYEKFPGQSNHS